MGCVGSCTRSLLWEPWAASCSVHSQARAASCHPQAGTETELPEQGSTTGVISGALPYIRDDLLSDHQSPARCGQQVHASRDWSVTSHELCSACRLSTLQGLIVSAAMMGAVFGSACGGALSDRLGRRTALLAADVLFVGGALCMGLAPSAALLIIGVSRCWSCAVAEAMRP